MKKERNWDYLRAVILKPEHASESPGRLVKKPRLLCPPPKFLLQWFWVELEKL